MKVCVLLVARLNLILLCLLLSEKCLSQSLTSRRNENSFLKISLYPMVWAAANNNLWITAHFENKLTNTITYNIVLDYYIWTYHQNIGTTYAFSLKGNQIFYFRPQLRYYFGKNAYEGFYIGLFPLYSYQEIRYESKYANYIGLGAISGYQLLIKDKYPIEFNVWFAAHTGQANKFDYSTGLRYDEKRKL